VLVSLRCHYISYNKKKNCVTTHNNTDIVIKSYKIGVLVSLKQNNFMLLYAKFRAISSYFLFWTTNFPLHTCFPSDSILLKSKEIAGV